jgi:biopolymer transport protein ExbD
MKLLRKRPSFIQPGREPDVLIDINTTPLIDVMLVLLIMVIVTIPTETHAVKMDLQAMVQQPPKPPPVVNVVIDPTGMISWDGTMLPDQATLDQRLISALGQAEQPEIHIHADADADYKFIAEILAEAQRLGVGKIGFAP